MPLVKPISKLIPRLRIGHHEEKHRPPKKLGSRTGADAKAGETAPTVALPLDLHRCRGAAIRTGYRDFTLGAASGVSQELPETTNPEVESGYWEAEVEYGSSERFVREWANPHSWLLAADDLHEQALAQYRRRDGSILMIRKDGGAKSWDGVDKSIFLLGGFAIENAIKAFLVYENPDWVAGGRLAKKLKSHSLTKLQAQSTLIPYKRRHIEVLKGFESGLDSWARYPCALAFDRTREADSLAPELWAGYLRVMRAYGNRLQDLLSKKTWHGPHGFSGRWRFQGEFFSMIGG